MIGTVRVKGSHSETSVSVGLAVLTPHISMNDIELPEGAGYPNSVLTVTYQNSFYIEESSRRYLKTYYRIQLVPLYRLYIPKMGNNARILCSVSPQHGLVLLLHLV
jgi:hypothetical protein